MPTYRIAITVDTTRNVKQIVELFRNVLADYGLTGADVSAIEAPKKGRPPSQNPKIEELLRRQVKPFSCKSFAKFIGVERSTAWKHLERLRRAGRITMESSPNGNVYRVVR